MGFALEKTYTAKTIERKMYKLSIKIFNSFKRQVMKNLKKTDKTFKKHLKKQMPLAAIDIIMPDIGDFSTSGKTHLNLSLKKNIRKLETRL